MTLYTTEKESEVMRILVDNGKQLIGKEFALDDYNSLIKKLQKCGLCIESEVTDDENITDRARPNQRI